MRDMAWWWLIALAACAGPGHTQPATPVANVDVAPTPTPAGSSAVVADEVAVKQQPDDHCLRAPITMQEDKYGERPIEGPRKRSLDKLLETVDGQCMNVDDGAKSRHQGSFPMQPSECKYAIARTYFETNRWADAARWFRRVAFEHADEDAGIHAAQLYLESLNVLGSRAEPPRKSCYRVMARDLEALACLNCADGRDSTREEACTLFRRIRFDLAHRDQPTTPSTDVGGACGPDERYSKGACRPLPPLVPARCP